MEKDNTYLFGIHSVYEALHSDRQIEKVYFREGIDNPQIRELLSIVRSKGVAYQFVPVEKLNSITNGRHQGVIAIMSKLDYTPIEKMVEDALSTSKFPFIVLLDGVSDVRNLGAIARSAECAGVSGIILPAKGGANINADAVKTSSGALLRVPVAKVTNLRMAVYYLSQCGFKIFVADEKSDKNIYDVDFKRPIAVIMGSEERGVSESVAVLAEEKIKIPQLGKIGSLNVSVAAAIIMYEAVRQKYA